MRFTCARFCTTRLHHREAGRGELAGAFTATIDVDLRVGALEETVTVTGQSPIVDTQGVAQFDF